MLISTRLTKILEYFERIIVLSFLILLAAINVFIIKHTLGVEIVLLVAVIAASRKIIIIGVAQVSDWLLISMGGYLPEPEGTICLKRFTKVLMIHHQILSTARQGNTFSAFWVCKKAKHIPVTAHFTMVDIGTKKVQSIQKTVLSICKSAGRSVVRLLAFCKQIIGHSE